MRSLLLPLTAFMAAVVSAIAYPESVAEGVALMRRQAPGTPQYDCHADCGGIITMSRSPGYCDFSNFTTTLDACLDCALVYDIWQYYGDSVTAAAEGCGINATPVPANATASATGTAQATAATSTGQASATSSVLSGSESVAATTTTTSAAATTSEASAGTSGSTTTTQSEVETSASSTASQTASETSSSTLAVSTGGAGSLAQRGPGLAMVPLGLLAAAIL